MSAGQFTQAKYQDDVGNVFKGRVQPETLALSINSTANANAGGAITAPVGIKFTAGNGETGVKARKVGVRFTSTLPAGYSGADILYIPVMTPTAFAAYTIGQTGTYLGEPVEVLSRHGESSN